jgi:WD40 repeat protein/serine/threonine protein kinase
MMHETVFAEHEEAIRRFEAAWERGLHGDLRDFIPKDARQPVVLLTELVQIDLEFRYRAGERPCVEEYIRHYSDLQTEDITFELLAGELALRDRYEARESPERLHRRFPELGAKLDAFLHRRGDPDRTRTPEGWTARRESVGVPVVADFDVGPEIGRGGMGVVYRAVQSSLGRTIAIKTFAHVPNAKAAARFHREAEAMARVDHPNIVPIIKVGEWSRGRHAIPYLAMKWYPGGSLESAPHGPATDPHGHARTVETIALAVHHAHQRGILHRDLKPSNILLDEAGHPAVCDFGLAGWYDPNEPNLLSESIVGTPAFMSPEQARDPSSITTAADVYGLGAILYFLLTGRPPIHGATPLAVLDRLESAVPDRLTLLNPRVSRDLETICLKCLEKNPAHRYAGADALAADLACWRQGLSISARRPGPWERLWRTMRRHPLATAAAFIMAASIIAVIVTLAISNDRIRNREQQILAVLEREQRSLYSERVATAGRLYLMNQLDQAWHTLDLCPTRFHDWEWHYLDRLRRNAPPTWHGTTEPIGSIAFLKNGNLLISDGKYNLRIWDGKEKTTTFPHRGWYVTAHPSKPWIAVALDAKVIVYHEDGTRICGPFDQSLYGWFAFDPTGRWLAFSNKNVVQIADLDTGSVVREFRGHTAPVMAGLFTSDGSQMLTGSFDRTIRRWDVATGEPVGEPIGNNSILLNMAWWQGETNLVLTGPSRIRFLDARTGRPILPPERAAGRPTIATHTKPDWLATHSNNGEIVLRTSLEGGELRKYRGHVGPINHLAVNAEGTRLASGGSDGSVRIWETDGIRESVDLAPAGTGYVGMALSADESKFAIAARLMNAPPNQIVSVFDANTGQPIETHVGGGDVTFDPRGRWMAHGMQEGGIVLLDPAGKVLTRWPTKFAVTRIRVSPDGRWLAAGENRGHVQIWDTADGSLRATIPIQSGRAVQSLAWSNRNHLAITAPNKVLIVNPKELDFKLELNLPQSPYAVSFHPDAARLAIAGQNRTLLIANPYENKIIRQMVGNPNTINAVAFHPGGSRLASAGLDGAVRIWDPDSGKELLTLHGGDADCSDVLWDRAGVRLFSLGSVVRCWTGGTPSP